MSFIGESSGQDGMARDLHLPSRVQPEISTRDILGRFGGLAQLQYPRSAKKRNSRYHVPRPSLALSLGLVKDMIGYWETRVEESVPTPCGCGDKNCPVSCDAFAAQHRWQVAMEKIRRQLQERKTAGLIQSGAPQPESEAGSDSDDIDTRDTSTEPAESYRQNQ